MITLLTGLPGSGKSYRAVDMISKLKDTSKVLHCIDGLKVGTSIDDYCLSNNCDPLDLFTVTFHENNNCFRGWLFVIDECQTYFPKDFRNKLVHKFFQLHRHYGIDIILLSQDYKFICPAISLLAESQYRAVSDTSNPLPWFLFYKRTIGYEVIGTSFLIKRKKIFKLYKTADYDQDKVRKKSRPMLIVFAVCAVLLIFGWYKMRGLSGGFHSDSESSPVAGKKNGPLPFEQQKRLSSQSQSFSSPDINTFPPSMEKTFHGRIFAISHISDSRGTSIPFLGFFFNIKDFPYPIFSTRTGLVAVLPPDVYDYARAYQSSLPDPDPSSYNTAVSTSTSSDESAAIGPSDRRGEGA